MEEEQWQKRTWRGPFTVRSSWQFSSISNSINIHHYFSLISITVVINSKSTTTYNVNLCSWRSLWWILNRYKRYSYILFISNTFHTFLHIRSWHHVHFNSNSSDWVFLILTHYQVKRDLLSLANREAVDEWKSTRPRTHINSIEISDCWLRTELYWLLFENHHIAIKLRIRLSVWVIWGRKKCSP